MSVDQFLPALESLGMSPDDIRDYVRQLELWITEEDECDK